MNSRSYELIVLSNNQKQDIFDLELVNNDGYITVTVGPRIKTASGCMVMTFEASDNSITEIVIQSITWNEKCTKTGSLEKKYGTRRMLLGSLLFVKNLVQNVYPHLNCFVLQDEATFACPPLSKSVQTFVTDILLLGETYYSRHLKMKPMLGIVRKCIERTNKRINEQIDISFELFWNEIITKDTSQTKKHIAWLQNNKTIIEKTYNKEKSWKSFFNKINNKFGCSFFACCGVKLVNLFDMNVLLGAVWTLLFEHLPDTIDGHKLTIKGGSGSLTKIRERVYIKWKKAHGLS